jgi:hypothetical protein
MVADVAADVVRRLDQIWISLSSARGGSIDPNHEYVALSDCRASTANVSLDYRGEALRPAMSGPRFSVQR